ncbi:MAG: hypothetical protein ACU837_09885 [Gammaproteobacteria bacterium]
MTIPKEILPLLGKWRQVAPWDSDDYLSEYLVGYEAGTFTVTGKDLQDDEEFFIYDISWDGAVLRFRSLMPSTGREGINEFRAVREKVIESRFTFTIVEELYHENL